MEKLFSYSFSGNIPTELKPILDNLEAIDLEIQTASPEWPIPKISKIDVSILRLSVFELTVNRNQPVKVIIDEAVELAKEFGNPSSPSFVNGVLGTIVKERKL